MMHGLYVNIINPEAIVW